MWATTKYVSVTWKSTGGEARMGPVSPPIRKTSRNPTAKSMGDSKVMWPRHMVAIQLNILTPVGTAMRNVTAEKNGVLMAPVANMWWAHTAVDREAMPRVARTKPL